MSDVTESELYKKFKRALNIQHDMRPGPNPFVCACCEIAEDHAADVAFKMDAAFEEIKRVGIIQEREGQEPLLCITGSELARINLKYNPEQI